MTQPTDLSGPGASSRASRLGPSLSVLGLTLWVVTLALYLIIKPPETLPGDPIRQGPAIKLVLAFVLGALGVFAASIVSAVGVFLSLSERRFHPGRRATRGVILGSLGIAALVLVIIEIFRLVFTTA